MPTAEGGQALLGVAAVLLEVLRGQTVEQGTLVGVDRPLLDQDLGHRPALGPGPGVEGEDQGRLVDHTGLEGEEAEERRLRGVSARRDIPWSPDLGDRSDGFFFTSQSGGIEAWVGFQDNGLFKTRKQLAGCGAVSLTGLSVE